MWDLNKVKINDEFRDDNLFLRFYQISIYLFLVCVYITKQLLFCFQRLSLHDVNDCRLSTTKTFHPMNFFNIYQQIKTSRGEPNQLSSIFHHSSIFIRLDADFL